MRKAISTVKIAWAAILLKVIDLFFTRYAMINFPSKEANPVMRTLFGWMGMDAALIATFIVYSAIVYHMYMKKKRTYLLIVNILMFIVVVNNWLVIQGLLM